MGAARARLSAAHLGAVWGRVAAVSTPSPAHFSAAHTKAHYGSVIQFFYLAVSSRPQGDIGARFPNGSILTKSGQSILGDHLEPLTPPKISLTHSPPLWDAGDAAQIESLMPGQTGL